MALALFVVVCVALAGGSVVRAEDSIKERLDKAKASHDSKSKAVREEVLKKLQAKEEQAAKAGNPKLADRAAAERETFEKEGLLPSAVDSFQARKDLEDAHNALVAAHKYAVIEYTKALMRADAKQVEGELAERQKAWAEVRLKEAFAVGSVLNGRKQNNPGGSGVPIQVTITERTGRTFKGEVVFNGQRAYNLSGEIAGDGVTMATEMKPNDPFVHMFQGKTNAKGTQIEFTFDGTGTGNNAVKGTATLSPTRK